MPLAEAALAYVAGQVIDQVASQALSSAGGETSRRLRIWLGRDPQQLACQVALARTEERFLARYPTLHSALFDEHFLRHGAAPVLARTLGRGDPPSPRDLATAFAAQFPSAEDSRLRDQVEPAAADFLRWWREELRRHEAFRPLFDSDALDRLADASVELADLTKALGALDRAFLRARYPELEDHVDWPSRRAARRPRAFVGRDWLFERLEEIASEAPAAYISVVAEAGLGKTAFALAVAARQDAPVFLFNEAAGRVDADHCLEHLCAELIDRHSLAHERLPDRAGPGFLAKLLDEAARVGPVWLVIDALDEAQALPLPEELPDGVFVLLTHRPGDYTPLVAPGAGTVRELRIRAADAHQRDDVVAYLRRCAYDIDVDVEPDVFVERLAAAAQGNFMYTAYVVDDLREGATLDLTTLPRGLEAYYERFWREISGGATTDWDTWERLQRPVVELLAVAAEPVTPAWLADVTGGSPAEIQRRALHAWRRFLEEENGAWRVVHQSFREFLTRTRDVDLREAHRAVATHFLSRWSDHGGYAARHLTEHLRLAGERDALFTLVERDDWRTAQIAYDPTGSAYRKNVSDAWDEATAANQAALAAGHPPWLLRELLFAIATAEQQSLVLNVPGELLVRLVEAGHWSHSQALAAASSQPDPVKRAAALTVLAAHFEGPARRRAAAAAAAAATAVADHAARAHALAALRVVIPDVEASRARAVAQAVGGTGAYDDLARANQLAPLADVLSPDERLDAIDAAEAIQDPRARLWTLLELGAPDSRLRIAALGLRAIAGEWDRYQAIEELAAQTPTALLGELLDVAVELSDPLRRWALNKVAPRLGGDATERALAVAETIEEPSHRFVTRALLGVGLGEPGFWLRARAVQSTAYAFSQFSSFGPPGQLRNTIKLAGPLSDLLSEYEAYPQAASFVAALAPRLDEPRLREAFAWTLELPDEDERAQVLEALAPLLPPDLVLPAFAAAVNIGAVHALAVLARDMPDPLPDAALLAYPETAARLSEDQLADAVAWTSSWDEADRGTGMALLAPHLPDSLLPAALEALAGPSTRASTLHQAIEVLGEHERPQAARLAVAAAAGDPDVEPWAVAAAAPYLPEPERRAAIVSALATTKQHDAEFRTLPLTALIPYLDAPERRWAIEQLNSAALTSHEVESTLPYLSDDDIDRLLDGGVDADVLIAFAPRLSAKQAEAALGALDDEVEEAPAAYAALVPRLDDPSRAAVLETLQQHGAVDELEAVAEALPPESRAPWLAAALAAAHQLTDPGARAEALAGLVPQLSGSERGAAIEAARKATAQITQWPHRVMCAASVAKLLPGPEGAHLAADALDMSPPEQRVAVVAHLAPVLGAQRDRLLVAALADVRMVGDPAHRAMKLVELVPNLPDALVEDALADALAIPHPDGRLVAVAAFAPRLDDERLAQLLRTFTEPLEYARGVADLVPHLGPLSAPAALEIAGRVSDLGEQAQALSALSDASVVDVSATYAQLARELRASAQRSESELYGTVVRLGPAIARVTGTRPPRT